APPATTRPPPVATKPSLPPAVPSRSDDAILIAQLQRERDDLSKKLDAANKELYGRKGKAVAARVEELDHQVATLHARLAVFEARQVPYTVEELALFRPPEPKLADPHAGKRSVKELPP